MKITAAAMPNPTSSLLFLVLLLFVNLTSSDDYSSNDQQQQLQPQEYQPQQQQPDVYAIEQALRARTRALVYVRGTPGYEAYRQVSNGGCYRIQPALIVRPQDTRDVSEIVRISTEYGIELSVRSGGHSYICQGTRQDSLNVDLRLLNTVRLLSPYEAVLGPGNSWGRVLKIIPNTRYTLIHGQCTQVGVGGYLLGIGNHLPSITARHGTGADSVIEHTVVLADGAVARVTRYNTTILDDYGAYGGGYGGGRVLQHGYDNDLRFALRSSGSSFGITTEFKIKVFPRPETLPMLIPIFIETSQDFRNIERASQQARYGFFLMESYFFRQPSRTQFVGNVLMNLPRIVKRLSGRKVEPVILVLSDIKATGRKGDIRKALNFLKYYGIKLGMDSPGLMSAIGMDGFDLSFPTVESAYLTDEERAKEGYAQVASANMIGLQTIRPFEKVFFTHPIFGRPYKGKSKGPGCDYCAWFIYLNNPQVPIDAIPGQNIGLVSTELSCSSNAYQSGKSGSCAAFMKGLKEEFTADALEVGERPSQYVNTPSCDQSGDPFYQRYWGQNYDRLLQIKNYWDPGNVFHHCHSVGSTSNDCCPI